MKWISNPCLVLLIATLVIINTPSYYGVEGAGYSTDQSRKGIDNGGNGGSANYQFEYGVKDGSAGQQFGHEEERNGQQTRGRYTVLLPDGRLQIVTYRADENGYNADVTYENAGNGAGSGGGYSGAAGNNGGSSSGGYGYDKVQTAATSYGPPVPPTQQNYGKGNSENSGFQGRAKSSASGNSGSFVKLRRTIDGKMFNIAY